MQSFLYHTKRPNLGLVQQIPALINFLIQRAIHCVRLPFHWSWNIQKVKLSSANHQAELARKPEVICPDVQCRVSEGRYTRREVCNHRIHRWVRSAVERLDVFHLKKTLMQAWPRCSLKRRSILTALKPSYPRKEAPQPIKKKARLTRDEDGSQKGKAVGRGPQRKTGNGPRKGVEALKIV